MNLVQYLFPVLSDIHPKLSIFSLSRTRAFQHVSVRQARHMTFWRLVTLSITAGWAFFGMTWVSWSLVIEMFVVALKLLMMPWTGGVIMACWGAIWPARRLCIAWLFITGEALLTRFRTVWTTYIRSWSAWRTIVIVTLALLRLSLLVPVTELWASTTRGSIVAKT